MGLFRKWTRLWNPAALRHVSGRDRTLPDIRFVCDLSPEFRPVVEKMLRGPPLFML